MTEEKKKTCLVICPIGPEGSKTRDRMNGIFSEVIAPVLQEFGYRTEIAIHGKIPGIVTEGIVTKLIEADLVIADLHGHDGNVMYQMALRHATGEAIVHMIPDGEEPPFDIAGTNSITYHFSIHQLERWRKDLRAALQAVVDGEAGANPVARAKMVRSLQAVAKTSMFPGLQAQVGGADTLHEGPSPDVERVPGVNQYLETDRPATAEFPAEPPRVEHLAEVEQSPQVEQPQVEQPQVEQPHAVEQPTDVEPPTSGRARLSVRPGILWKSSATRSGWMKDLHHALATHALAEMLDSFGVDLEEVDGDLIQVTVYEVNGDERSATRLVTTYKIRAFADDAADVAHRIWARVVRDVQREDERGEN